MSASFEIQKVGVGGVFEAEKQAVRWLTARRISRGAWKALLGADRIFVRRCTGIPYDLLIWTARSSPGEAWTLFQNDENSRSLVGECLAEFADMGLVHADMKMSYESFCTVVHREQTVQLRSATTDQTSAGSFKEFVGTAAILADGPFAFPATVIRAVRRPDGLVIELKGQIEGSHYTAEANLVLRGGRYIGTAAMVGVEQKEWARKADVWLASKWENTSNWELAGEWVERGEGSEEDCAFDFELELQANNAR